MRSRSRFSARWRRWARTRARPRAGSTPCRGALCSGRRMPLHYPTAFVRLSMRLEELGPPEPDRIITLEYFPISLTVHRNRWNEADKIEAVVDFEDFPLDPRILRGVTIEAFLADAKSLDTDFWEKQDGANLVAENAIFAGV